MQVQSFYQFLNKFIISKTHHEAAKHHETHYPQVKKYLNIYSSPWQLILIPSQLRVHISINIFRRISFHPLILCAVSIDLEKNIFKLSHRFCSLQLLDIIPYLKHEEEFFPQGNFLIFFIYGHKKENRQINKI
jgi:hypothetical protein